MNNLAKSSDDKTGDGGGRVGRENSDSSRPALLFTVTKCLLVANLT